jgi:hemoglobin
MAQGGMTILSPEVAAEQDIERLVRRFYEKARAEPTLGPVFNSAIHDWEPHIATLTDFWSSVTLASGRYKGDPFSAHLPLGLQPDWFPIWLRLWREKAHEVFPAEVAQVFVEKAERIARSLSSGLFFRP